MRFKEAVLKGCEMYPKQCVVRMYYPPTGHACVMGAALAGIGVHPELAERSWPFVATERWSFLRATRRCPACRMKDHAAYVVVHLNDRHGWSREKIAEWADGLEAETIQTSTGTERPAATSETPETEKRAVNKETPEEVKREEELVPA